MTTIVTGASGFVGKNLVQHLEKQGLPFKGLSLRGAWENELPRSFKAIIHLAGKAHDLKSSKDERAYFDINTNLTKSVFDRFLASDVTDFIYFSSVKAVADQIEGVLTEDVLPAPQTAYGKSKLEAEQCILSTGLPKNKRVIILRPCMIHGPGNKGNLNLLYGFVNRGIPYPLAGFENRRSFLSIDNLCFILVKLLSDSKIPSGIYNLADDESLSTNDLIRIIAQVQRKKPRLLHLPKSLVAIIARMGDFLHLPLTTERLNKLTEDYVVSNEKIKHVLGIDRLPTSAREGLMKTISSFKADNPV